MCSSNLLFPCQTQCSPSSPCSPSTTWLSAILPSLVGSLAWYCCYSSLVPTPGWVPSTAFSLVVLASCHPNLIFMAELISKHNETANFVCLNSHWEFSILSPNVWCVTIWNTSPLAQDAILFKPRAVGASLSVQVLPAPNSIGMQP